MKTFLRTTFFQALLRHQTVAVAIYSVFLLFPAQHVNAGITTCTLADGRVVFQDTACTVIPEKKKEAAPIADTAPLGIDKTWFDAPGVVAHQAMCTRAGCDCGAHYREFENGLLMAVADALYLDGSWHRLDAIIQEIEFSTHSTANYDKLRQERDEAACNILISQKTLQMYGEKALTQLRTQKRHAEDMGWDDPADCYAGNLSICKHTDNIALYNRILADVQALARTNRTGDTDFEKNDIMASDER